VVGALVGDFDDGVIFVASTVIWFQPGRSGCSISSGGGDSGGCNGSCDDDSSSDGDCDGSSSSSSSSSSSDVDDANHCYYNS